jgi:hypothetical protein
VAQKTALKDCNNHMGVPVELDAEQIIASAQAAGIPVVVPEGAWLDSEQAGALVAEAVQAHVRQVDPPNVVKREAEHDYMREGFPDGEQDAAEPDLAPAEWPAALVAIEPYRVRLCANICHVTPATARQRNWMVGALTLLDPDEANQSDLLEWAFGIPTLDLLTAGMGEGLVEWLAPTKDTKGDMQIDPAAQQQYAEIKAALDAWAQEHAQPTLLNA